MISFNKVYFRVFYGAKEFDKNGQKIVRRSATVVAVVDEKTDVPMREREILSLGEAFCSLKDNFSRAKGRKLALARCIANLGWDEETRKAFWKEYNNKFQKGE